MTHISEISPRTAEAIINRARELPDDQYHKKIVRDARALVKAGCGDWRYVGSSYRVTGWRHEFQPPYYISVLNGRIVT